MKPTIKYFGSITLSELKAAVAAAQASNNLSEYNGEAQLKIGAAKWEDGNISIEAYDKETKTSFKLGNLRVSQFEDTQSASTESAPAEDLPF